VTARGRHVVVVGRDAALWLTAAALGKALAPTGITITAIELPSHLSTASTYLAQPAIEALHAKLGLDERALLRATQGSFSLGYNVIIGEGAASPFFLAHGSYGTPIAGGDFFGQWLRARHFGLGAALEDFSPTAMAARHGRVMLPDQETEGFGRTDYGYHLPGIAYAALLKELALRSGVALRQAPRVSVEREVSGRVRAVVTTDGEAIHGDLYVDASGPEAAVIGKASNGEREDWRRHFPLDRCRSARAPGFASVPTYAEIRSHSDGWTALYATRGMTHVVHAYRAADQDEASSLAAAAARAGLRFEEDYVIAVAPGRRVAGWTGNCVAIGGAACAFDPLFDLELHAVQLGIVHLLSLFPADRDGAAEQAEYNRVTASLFDRVRDFQAAYYTLTMMTSPPQSLAARMALFSARGAIAPMEDDSFTTDHWRALLLGLGIQPEDWPPAIDTIPPERLRQGLRDILGFVNRKVLNQPTHDCCLGDRCE